jgi:ferredoxin-thioredoxin reductase catalytic subunit
LSNSDWKLNAFTEYVLVMVEELLKEQEAEGVEMPEEDGAGRAGAENPDCRTNWLCPTWRVDPLVQGAC